MTSVPLLTATALVLSALPALAQTAAIDSSAARRGKGRVRADSANLTAIKQTDATPQGTALTPEKDRTGQDAVL